MTRAIARAAFALALTAILAGCTTVHVGAPVGQLPAALDPADWNGTWCAAAGLVLQPGTWVLAAPDDDCLVLTVVDPAAGILDVASSSDPGDSWRAHLRRVRDDPASAFVSVEDGAAAFTFELRARRDGNAVIAWSVSGTAVAAEVEAGRLAGRVEEESVYLDTGAPGTLERLASDGGGLFDWTHPVVLVRVTGP
jgi:hypothetical protein